MKKEKIKNLLEVIVILVVVVLFFGAGNILKNIGAIGKVFAIASGIALGAFGYLWIRIREKNK